VTPPIKLLAIDLDGTVVNHQLQVSPAVIEAIAKAKKDHGVRVMIATGRTYHSALPFASQLGITEPLVAYQGALLRELPEQGGATLRHCPIPLPLAQEVLAMLQAHQFHVNVYVNDQLFVERDNPYAKDYGRLAGFPPTLVDDLMAQLTSAPSKLMAIDHDRMDWLLSTLHQHYATRLNICTSRINFCEIIDKQASKWDAVWSLAQQWGFNQTEIMAIGDQQNDLSMLTQAGLGVAMGNAPLTVKHQAKAITGSIDEDGVALAIERFILSPNATQNRQQLVLQQTNTASCA
jgi:Cof subfamily protein (haloacid dehalogenase superfamily)